MLDRLRRAWVVGMCGLACFGLAHARAQESGVLGMWRTPSGSVIEVHRCGGDICARLVTIEKGSTATVDEKNPDRALQQRPLAGLEIGQGFHLIDPGHAEDGKIYDPKVGKTYHASMVNEGDTLKLRGYVGIKAFGRTEVWTRQPGK